MSNRIDKIYFCRICGNEVKFVRDGGGKLICCGEDMQIKKEGFDSEEQKKFNDRALKAEQAIFAFYIDKILILE